MGVREALGTAVVDAGKKVKGETGEPQEPLGVPKAPWWVVLLTFFGALVLVFAGGLVLKEGKEFWDSPDDPVVVGPPTKEVTEETAAVKGDEPSAAKTTTTVERKSMDGGRSQELAIAILATGAGLLLAGGFAARLTSVKLPGGVELAVTAAYNQGAADGTASTAVAAATAKEQGADDVLDNQETLAQAGAQVLQERIGSTRVPSGTGAFAQSATPILINDEYLHIAAERVIEELRTSPGDDDPEPTLGQPPPGKQ